MMDLLSTAVGGRVVDCNDEFFAAAANLLRPGDPVWDPHAYTDRGKLMDGWETRRRREPGHDWCVVALGIAGRVEELVVDTSYFTGNYPEAFSVDACGVESDRELRDEEWVEVVARTPLQGDAVAAFPVTSPYRVTYLRLNIHPDGGIARFRARGTPIPAMDQVCPGQGRPDLVSALVGGESVEASDVHYSPPSNLLRPTEPAGMWDGWETRRRRGPGHDWVVLRLGLPGVAEQVVVDTRHFKGNAPGWVSLHVSEDGRHWEEAVTRAAVAADSVSVVTLEPPVHARWVRLDIHPDGGVARLRLHGRPDPEAAAGLRLLYLNSLLERDARRFFRSACASALWGERMAGMRPFPDVDSVFGCAQEAFDHLGEPDWLEAFAGHPRIGERGDATAGREQSGTASASREVLNRLTRVNEEYEAKFAFTYIVYATGKSAEGMLEIAESRLDNTRSEEIVNASIEQRAITVSRLRRMLCLETPR